MSNVTLLAVDLAKNVFQLHGIDAHGKTVLKQKISRDKLLNFAANLKPCDIYMEGCGSANYWGREFKKFGHKVKLINPKYVKPFVKRNKNDKNDAEAIAVAARAPGMRFGCVKSETQQDVQGMHRVRSLLLQQRTALINQARGLLAEYGITIAKGRASFCKKIPEILGENANNLSALMLKSIITIYSNFKAIEEAIAGCDKEIAAVYKANETCRRLEKVPGIGPLGATILVAMLGNNGSEFKNGRHFAAFLGLVPKQHSSGSKNKLLGISKGGDTYVRTLLIHGARAALRWSGKKTDNQNLWLNDLKKRCKYNVVAVALANKMARTAWAIVHGDCNYDPNYKSPLFGKV